MTHLGNWQGLAEVLSCPEEAETGVCLFFPEVTNVNPGKDKYNSFVLDRKKNIDSNKHWLSDHVIDSYVVWKHQYKPNKIQTTRKNIA